MSKERDLLKECRLILDTPFNGSTGIKLLKEIQTLLTQPEQTEQEPVAWIETKGKEPSDWEDYEYIWTHWKSGRISLDEAYGCWTWEDITHWMPANIIEPSKPRIDNE